MDVGIRYDDRPLLQRVRLSRPLTSYSVIQRILSPILRNRLALGAKGAVYLNAGCGTNVRSGEGWANLDYHWRPGVNVCWDLRRRLPFNDGTFIGVFCEHCLEHFTREDAARVVRELHRILRPGGTLRVVVPDAGLYAETYVRKLSGERVRFPYQDDGTPMEHLNAAFRGHGHLYAYDFETMAKLLAECGFTQIARADFMVGREAKLLIDAEWRRPESLYIEATNAEPTK